MIKIEITGDTMGELRAQADDVFSTPSVQAVTVEIPNTGDDVAAKLAAAIASTGTKSAEATAVTLAADPNAAPVVLGAESVTDPLTYDAAGVPWDARIHTANKACKADGTWKRKPKLTDEFYNTIFAELQQVAPTPAAGVAPVVDPNAAGVIPATPAVPALPAAGGPTLNDVMDKSAQLVSEFGPLGTTMLPAILSKFNAVVDSQVPGQPPLASVSALELRFFGPFLQTCDAIIGNKAAFTEDNLDSMIDVLMVRQ